MAHALFSGIGMGLMLAALIGPIFFTLIQTAIERGFRAGIAVALGEWLSDMLFILATYYSITWLEGHFPEEAFNHYMGLIGGIILILFGASSLVFKPKTPENVPPLTAKSLAGYLLKGIAINSINPFTFVFWIGTTSAYVVKGALTSSEATAFYSGIIGTIAVFDILKIWAAKQLRERLEPKHILLMRRIAGIALILSGVFMIGRSI